MHMMVGCWYWYWYWYWPGSWSLTVCSRRSAGYSQTRRREMEADRSASSSFRSPWAPTASSLKLLLRLWTATSSQEKLETEKVEALRRHHHHHHHHHQCGCMLRHQDLPQDNMQALLWWKESNVQKPGGARMFFLSLISMIFSPVFMTCELVENSWDFTVSSTH